MKCPTYGGEQWKRGTTPHVEEVDGRKSTTDRLQALRKGPRLAKVVRLDLKAAARR